jgi:iron complex outermembrane receptor protein
LVLNIFGFNNQTKTITINTNSNTLNINLEQAIFKMDEVIISTALIKLQSQNVMKVEHASKLQQNGTATLIEGLATIPGVSQISTGTSIGKPVIRGLEW